MTTLRKLTGWSPFLLLLLFLIPPLIPDQIPVIINGQELAPLAVDDILP